VTNTGGTTGDYSLELKIDGIVKSSKQVTVAAGTSQTVKFTTTAEATGKHSVEISGIKGEFVVSGPSGINWWLIAAIIGILLLATGSILGWRRFKGLKKATATPADTSADTSTE